MVPPMVLLYTLLWGAAHFLGLLTQGLLDAALPLPRLPCSATTVPSVKLTIQVLA